MPIRFDLSKYKNPVFVETGTYHGDSVKSALLAGFEKVYSIEIDKKLYEDACKRFESEIHAGVVQLILGDSASCLPKLIATLEQRCTFWLDAHSQKFNFENDTTGIENCPLYWELDTIAQSCRKDHSILIDDLRLVKNKSAWRGHNVTFDGVLERLHRINSKYSLQFEDGHIENDVLTAHILSKG